MTSADNFFASMLEAGAGFGQPDAFKSQATKADRGLIDFDFTGGGQNAKSMAQQLLSPGSWTLLQQLSGEEVHRVAVYYSLEREGADLSSPNLRQTTVVYPEPSSRKETALACRGGASRVESIGVDVAERALANYTRSVSTNSSPGAGSAQHHAHLTQMHKHVESLLVVMWLIHLDVAAGAEPVVALDQMGVHAGLSNVTDPADECEEAKSIDGVRLHVNSCDNTTKALLAAACDYNAIANLGRRAERYKWTPSRLTLYGGLMSASVNVPLTNPDATARAIISFGHRFASPSEMSAALETALLLYGLEDGGTRVVLDVPAPQLHEDSHRLPMTTSGLARTRELAGSAIVALSLFLGRAYMQVAGAVLRSAVLTTGAKDLHGAEHFLRRNHELLQVAAGAHLAQTWGQLHPNYIHHGTMLHVNFVRAWQQLGVLHALMAGCVTEGSIFETVTNALELGTALDTTVTDSPSLGQSRADEMVTWYILSELLRDGGEHLNGSRAAIKRSLGASTRLHAETRQYAGTRARFIISGLGAPLLLRTVDNSTLALDPTPQEAAESNVAEVDTGNDTALGQLADRPALRGEDWVNALVTQRGPIASTVMQRAKPPVYKAGRSNGTQIVIERLPEDARLSVGRASRLGWGPEPTPGHGMLCGARAITQSLRAVAALRNEPEPLYDTVRTAVQFAMTDEQRQLAEVAGVATGIDNFTVDQLTAGLQQLGDYRLGVVTSVNGQGNVVVHGSGNGEIVLVHHDGRAHWSSIGPKGVRSLGLA